MKSTPLCFCLIYSISRVWLIFSYYHNCFTYLPGEVSNISISTFSSKPKLLLCASPPCCCWVAVAQICSNVNELFSFSFICFFYNPVSTNLLVFHHITSNLNYVLLGSDLKYQLHIPRGFTSWMAPDAASFLTSPYYIGCCLLGGFHRSSLGSFFCTCPFGAHWSSTCLLSSNLNKPWCYLSVLKHLGSHLNQVLTFYSSTLMTHYQLVPTRFLSHILWHIFMY